MPPRRPVSTCLTPATPPPSSRQDALSVCRPERARSAARSYLGQFRAAHPRRLMLLRAAWRRRTPAPAGEHQWLVSAPNDVAALRRRSPYAGRLPLLHACKSS